MSRPRKLPQIDTVWSANDDPHRRIRIVAHWPVGEPSGVEALVLSSVSWDRWVLMAFRDLTDNYEQEVTT